MSTRVLWIIGVIALVGVSLSTIASAHERSVSYLDLRVEARPDGAWDARLTLNLRRLDLSRVAAADRLDLGPLSQGAPPDAAASDALAELVTLTSGADACAVTSPASLLGRSDAARTAFALSLRCPARPTDLEVRGLWSIPGHLAVLTVHDEPASPHRQLLTALAPTARWGQPPSNTPALVGGALHILSGYDHVAFVLLLLLGVRRLRDAALIVTGFTLGHSMTLSMMALGWVEVDARAVEAVIAFSVLALAADNAHLMRQRAEQSTLVEENAAPALAGILGVGLGVPALLGAGLVSASGMRLLSEGAPPERVRQVLAALFGMAHGLGFAGALTHTGSTPSLGLLLTWNIGVELGQLAIILLAWPALMALEARGHGDTWRTLGVGAGAFVGALALVQALSG